MKKTFPLQAPGKADARVVESVKSDVRKYVKRELRKTPPEGFDLWTLQCRAGATDEAATACEVAEIGRIVDAVASTGSTTVYVEIVAVPGLRTPRPIKAQDDPSAG